MSAVKEAAPLEANPVSCPGARDARVAKQGTLASISLDLDNQWSYMKTHGDAGWESFPSYLDVLSEIVLERLARHGLTITFFIVGQDAALEKNSKALRAIADAGHEIGNHSFRHEPWLHRYSYHEIEQEIENAETHIERATGRRPRGFRGPGFSSSPDVLRVLARRGYAYDASTFPTFLGPLARAYYFWSTRGLSREERDARKKLFGSAGDGFRPLRPYAWDVEGTALLEIPVTTMPVFRVPIHLSYLIYLAKFSRLACRAYLRLATTLLKATGTEPSFLLHPLDFLGSDKVKGLEFFPGMSLPTAEKLRIFDEVIARLKTGFQPVTMATHAAAILARGAARRRPLDDRAGSGGSGA